MSKIAGRVLCMNARGKRGILGARDVRIGSAGVGRWAAQADADATRAAKAPARAATRRTPTGSWVELATHHVA